MAWTEWHWNKNNIETLGEKKIYSSYTGKNEIVYTVVAQWAWRQNMQTRETELLISQAIYKSFLGANIGYPQAATFQTGLGFSISNNKADGVYQEKTFSNVRVTPNTPYTFQFNDIRYCIKHNLDGSLPEIFLLSKCLIDGWVGDALVFDWKAINITSKIPTIPPAKGAPSGGKATVLTTSTSATIQYSDFVIPGGLQYYEIKINNNWVNNGSKTSYTLLNLKPNQSYQIQIRVVDKYGQMSSPLIVYFNTDGLQAQIWIKEKGKWIKGKVWVKHGQWKTGKKTYIKISNVWYKIL